MAYWVPHATGFLQCTGFLVYLVPGVLWFLVSGVLWYLVYWVLSVVGCSKDNMGSIFEVLMVKDVMWVPWLSVIIIH